MRTRLAILLSGILGFAPGSPGAVEAAQITGRARFVGISNLMTFVGILASAGAFYLLNNLLGLSPSGIFTASAAPAGAVAAPVLYYLRGDLQAFLARVIFARNNRNLSALRGVLGGLLRA